MRRAKNTLSLNNQARQSSLKRTLGIVLVMLIAAASLLAAQHRPNFSGRWELDTAKSQLRPNTKWDHLVLLIEHQEPKLNLKMTTKYSDGHEETRQLPLLTDGSAVSEGGGAKGARIHRANWAGAKLVLKMEVPNQVGGRTETWELAPDGKTLTIRGSVKLDDGTTETWKHVLSKK
jgi:hypothetical protein